MVRKRAISFILFVMCCASVVLANDNTASHAFIPAFERFFVTKADKSEEDGGKLLLSELSCTACHKPSRDQHAALVTPKKGPILDGIGDRINVDWIRRFVIDPQSVKPGTTMPSMFDGLTDEQQDAAIEPLLHLLMNSRSVESQFEIKRKSAAVDPIRHEFYRKGNAESGKRLFHQVGCVACHEPDGSYDSGRTYLTDRQKLLKDVGLTPEEAGDKVEQPIASVPLPKLHEKYTRKSLTYFVFDPLRIRPAGRMPQMKLDPEEAAHLAAYLLRRTATSGERGSRRAELDSPSGSAGASSSHINATFKLSAELVERGQIIFQRIGCANCHKLDELKPTRFSKPLDRLSEKTKRNCIDGPHPPLPNFNLNPHQRAALKSQINEPGLIGVFNGPSIEQERVSMTMFKLNCHACHERDRHGGVGPRRRQYFETVDHIDIGDEGRLPPSLSEVGNKLTEKWLRAVLDGTGDVRPYMQARMPVFGNENVAHLPADFMKVDPGVSPKEAQAFLKPRMSNGDSEAGRQFMNTGCIQCHRFRGEKLPGVEGIDLATLQQRLQPLWFYQFLENPGAVKPRTRMPTFFPKGKSTNRELLGGDMNRQIAAVWAYLKDDSNKRLPDRLENEKEANFELVPTDEPILLRTFMKDVGTQAIAVGFPRKLHYVFDANTVRFAYAWKGKFLDAHSTWFNRFIPEVEPLGEKQVMFPKAVPFAVLKDSKQPWPKKSITDLGFRMKGFRLDKTGTPTFLYGFQKVDVEDRMAPDKEGKALVRTIRLSGSGSNIWFRGLSGVAIQNESEGEFLRGGQIPMKIKSPPTARAQLRLIENRFEVLYPVKLDDGPWAIEIEYRW